ARDNIDAAGLHLARGLLPESVRLSRVMEFADHRQERPAVESDVMAVDLETIPSGIRTPEVQVAPQGCGNRSVENDQFVVARLPTIRSAPGFPTRVVGRGRLRRYSRRGRFIHLG